MMENLNIKSSHGTIPKVVFDASTGKCEISGESSPEDVLEFFKDLDDWLYGYIDQIKGPIHLVLNLKYFNTASSRGIFKILTILNKYQMDGGVVNITWHYDEEDDDMHDEIDDQSLEANISILKVPH